MILEQETFDAYGYYPSSLKPHSGKHILAKCDDCGKLRSGKKQSYRALCHSCSRKGYIHTEETKAKISETETGKEISDETKHKLRESHIGIRRCEKIERICKFCGKRFFVYPYIVKNGNGIYCSLSCVAKARIHNARPDMTAPEKAFESLCIKNELPFKFVGDGSLWFGNVNPDFIHTGRKKIVVEVFGDYWHSPLVNRNIEYVQTLEGRTAQLKAEGYKTIILWETDLMREDAESFILHEMHKEGIGHKAKKEEE